MPTQLPRVPSLIPSSFATLAIGRDVSITIFTASSLTSGEKLFFGRGNYFTFPDIHPNGWTVRRPRGTPARLQDAIAGSAVVHTDDIAWWHSRFGWAGLLIDGILVPFHRGELVSFRPP